MRVLVFDTETTGFLRPNLPLDDHAQPHCVQLGAKMIDLATKNVFSVVNLTSKPDGWVIPFHASEVHGITMERAMRTGISETMVGCVLKSLMSEADLIVGHNLKYDMGIAEVLFARSGLGDLPVVGTFCTMEKCTDIVRCPPTERMLRAGRRGYKQPKLIEAYRHFFGEDFVGAHDAMADVNATLRVFMHMYERGLINL